MPSARLRCPLAWSLEDARAWFAEWQAQPLPGSHTAGSRARESTPPAGSALPRNGVAPAPGPPARPDTEPSLRGHSPSCAGVTVYIHMLLSRAFWNVFP